MAATEYTQRECQYIPSRSASNSLRQWPVDSYRETKLEMLLRLMRFDDGHRQDTFLASHVINPEQAGSLKISTFLRKKQDGYLGEDLYKRLLYRCSMC